MRLFQIAIFSLISFAAAQYASQDKEISFTQGYEVTTPVSIKQILQWGKINVLRTNIKYIFISNIYYI